MLAGPDPAVVSILRAGNGLLDGVLDVVPTAKVGFVGLYRDEETLRPVEYYNKLPSDMPGRFYHSGRPDAGHRPFRCRSH